MGKQWQHKQMHKPWQAVTFQVQQVKNVGAGGWPSARGQKVVLFTSHRDNLWCDGSWGGLADTRKTLMASVKHFPLVWMFTVVKSFLKVGFSQTNRTSLLASRRQKQLNQGTKNITHLFLFLVIKLKNTCIFFLKAADCFKHISIIYWCLAPLTLQNLCTLSPF